MPTSLQFVLLLQLCERHSVIVVLTAYCIAEFCVQSVSTTADQVSCLQEVDLQLQHTGGSEPVTSLGDVALSDTESSDTATKETDPP